MKNNLYTHATLTPALFTQIGGGKLCNCGKTLSSRLRTLFIFIGISFTLLSCEKEVSRYQEIQAYHAESLQLPSQTADSVSRFAHKVEAFVVVHPDAKEDPLYPEIVRNIQTVRLTITLNTDWSGDDYHVNF